MMRIFDSLPKKCWLFTKNTYLLFGNGSADLPYVGLEYEFILKWHKLPYRKKDVVNDAGKSITVCEYGDPECFNEEEITLPLFAEVPTGYAYCGRRHSEKRYTKATIDAALKKKPFVDEEINKYKDILRQVHHYLFAKDMLNGKIAIACQATDLPHCYSYNISMNHDNFKIMWISYKVFAIFDMNKVPKNGYIELYAPKHIAGLVIGRDAWHVKALAKEVGVKKIRVVPV